MASVACQIQGEVIACVTIRILFLFSLEILVHLSSHVVMHQKRHLAFWYWEDSGLVPWKPCLGVGIVEEMFQKVLTEQCRG